MGDNSYQVAFKMIPMRGDEALSCVGAGFIPAHVLYETRSFIPVQTASEDVAAGLERNLGSVISNLNLSMSGWSMEKTIKLNAELLIKKMQDQLGVTLSYDEKSVACPDDYIVRIRSTLSRDTTDKLIDVLGSFLGECIRHCHGGNFRRTDRGCWT